MYHIEKGRGIPALFRHFSLVRLVPNEPEEDDNQQNQQQQASVIVETVSVSCSHDRIPPSYCTVHHMTWSNVLIGHIPCISRLLYIYIKNVLKAANEWAR